MRKRNLVLLLMLTTLVVAIAVLVIIKKDHPEYCTAQDYSSTVIYPDYMEQIGVVQHRESFAYTPFPYPSSEWMNFYSFDDDGVVIVHRQKEDKFFYNAVTIAQYALASWHDFTLTGDPSYKRSFLANANYLFNNYQQIDEDEVAYPYYFRFDNYGGIEPPWYSAMAQGNALSALAHLYRLKPSKGLEVRMRHIKNFMKRPINEGGSAAKTPEGYAWVAEYAISPTPYVLNGFVFSIMGLVDYLSVFPEDTETQDYLNDLLSTLKNTIELYDTGTWLLYDRYKPKYVSLRYLEFQTIQSYQLYEITRDRFFLKMFEKWKSYYYDCIKKHSDT